MLYSPQMSLRYWTKLLLWILGCFYALTLLGAKTGPRPQFGTDRAWSVFVNYDLSNPTLHRVNEDKRIYFFKSGKHVCSNVGTVNVSLTTGCLCRHGWYGLDCGIPDMVYFPLSELGFVDKLRRRQRPRRVIHAFNINHEFDLVEAKLNELVDVVDVFVICESNYTAHGDQKQLRFLDRLAAGFLAPFHPKIVYVFLDHFPENGTIYGWVADDYLRTFLGRQGLSQIAGTRPDDVFLLSDADEIPRKEALLFLKLYDGWPEPVALHMRWFYYGFFWKHRSPWKIVSATSLKMLKVTFDNDAICVRRTEKCINRKRFGDEGNSRQEKTFPVTIHKNTVSGKKNLKKGGVPDYSTDKQKSAGDTLAYFEWTIGDMKHPAGWHCSWCFSPDGIIIKMTSAQNGDFPRWGDYPELQNRTKINEMIVSGTYFDGNSCNMQFVGDPETDRFFAPRFLLENKHRFKYLLDRGSVSERTESMEHTNEDLFSMITGRASKKYSSHTFYVRFALIFMFFLR